jgi:hypothetical protein
MADTSPAVGAGGLSQFDLPNVFRCAAELAEAAAALDPTEWAQLPVDIDGPASPHFERWTERHRLLERVEEEAARLKRTLGATGPLDFPRGETDASPRWESYDQHFNSTTHDRVVRLALTKLATAAIDLSGFATWRDWQWPMRETGLRLLTWGLAQLWEGMSAAERSAVRDRLSHTHQAIGWPPNPATDPPAYDGPEEIPLPDRHRTVVNYISCRPGYLAGLHEAFKSHVEQNQEEFLRRATLVQFVERAERAEQALQAMAKRGFDSAAEWGDLYTRAFWPLACLRRAHEVGPREAWPAPALEQRKVLADAAGILLTWVGGTPAAKAAMNPADADKAWELFTQAIQRLRTIADAQAGTRQSDGANFTLGRLLDALRDSEAAFAANSETADRVESRDGGMAVAWWRLQAAALRFQPDPVQMPGIDRIQLLCDELDNGGGLTAANVARIRAKVCRAKPCGLEEANALALHEAADVLEAHLQQPGKPNKPAPAVVQAKAAAAPGSNAWLALTRVFTNGLSDDRIEKAAQLLADDKLTVNEKLTKIDALIPLPATASAEQLADMLGVTKQAVLKTAWWVQNRKGERESEVGRRRECHHKRARSYEAPGPDEEDG